MKQLIEGNASFLPLKYSLGLSNAAQIFLLLLHTANRHFGIEFSNQLDAAPPIGIKRSYLLDEIGVAENKVSNPYLFLDFIVQKISQCLYFTVTKINAKTKNEPNPNIFFQVVWHGIDAAFKRSFFPWDDFSGSA